VITGALAGGHQHFGEAWAYYYPNFSPEAWNTHPVLRQPQSVLYS
jgi:hypothetical protein